MQRIRFRTMVWLLGLTVVFGSGAATGQQSPPSENKGLRVGSTAMLDLGPEIEGMQGRQLRLRVLTLEPGGVIRMHSHKDLPAVAYLLEGTVMEYREGGRSQVIQKGAAWSEGKDVTHWAENKGTTPAVIVVADIFKP